MSPSLIKKFCAKLRRKFARKPDNANKTGTRRVSKSGFPPSYSSIHVTSIARKTRPSGDNQASSGPSQRSTGDKKNPTKQRLSVDKQYVVQLCLHETLSFERMQRILALPEFKQSHAAIDALGATAMPQHTRRQQAPFRRCKPRGTDTHIGTGGIVKLRYISTDIQPGTDSTGYTGLELSSSWTLYPIIFTRPAPSKASLKLYLDRMRLPICPHHGVNDPAIVELIHKVMHPDDLLIDPIDEWLAKVAPERHGKPYKHACAQCATVCEIAGTQSNPTLQIRRWLGEGQVADDPVWRAQCVVLG